MIEGIFRACEIILICVAAFVVGYVLFCAVCATVKATSGKIKKNRLKKFIKDNEKKLFHATVAVMRILNTASANFTTSVAPVVLLGLQTEIFPNWSRCGTTSKVSRLVII